MPNRPMTSLPLGNLYLRVLRPLLLLTLLALPVHAGTMPDNIHEQDHPQVIVSAEAEDSLSGKNSLDAQTIADLPMKEGSLNEALLTLPGVQRPNSYGSSTSAGEILAPEISISGGKFYENQIQLDGVSVDQRVDPVKTINTPQDVPANIQTPMIKASLLGEIDLYRYNVPASYGGFTGGVVSASIRDPKPDFSLATSYRTTSDSVTKFHVDPEDRDEFNTSNDESRQPRFRKHDWGVEADIPLTFSVRSLYALHQLQSKIPLSHLGGTKTQRRRNDNYILKGTHETGRSNVSLSAIYTPYTADYFKAKTYASDYTLEGGGLILAGNAQLETGQGLAQLNVGLSESYSKRDDDIDYFVWRTTASKPWGSIAGTSDAGGDVSYEGGYGDIDRKQRSYTFHPSFTTRPLRLGPSNHAFATGFEFIYNEASFTRKDQSHYYYSPQTDILTTCSDEDTACLDNEQYLSRRTVYDPSHVEALQKHSSFYVEDTMTFGRLVLRPGMRFTNDSITENNDLSPRLAVALDIFDDGATILRGGANRYYSSSPICYILREGISPIYRERRTLTELSPGVWTPSDWNEYYRATWVSRYSELKTPYADEYAAALDIQLLSGRAGILALEFIRRDSKDQIARELNIPAREYLLNNNGRSRHTEYALNWELLSEAVDVNFNVTYQDNRTSNATYDILFDDAKDEELVWYDGEAIPRWELPSNDYNRPWLGNLLVTFRIPTPAVKTTFSNLTRYTGHYRDIEKLDTIPAEAPPEVVEAYEEIKVNDVWTFDWKLGIEVPFSDRQSLTVSLEAYNVFNAKTRTTSEDSDYYLGRQFWAGLSYRF